MPTEEEQEKAQQLKEIRRNLPKNNLEKIRSTVSKAKNVPNIASLITHIDPFTDWLFGIALSLALLKDILDLVGIGSLPAIGTVVTFIVSLSIGFIMLITGSRSKSKMMRSLIKSGAKKYGVLVFGSIIEMIFGIDFLPIETTVVIIVFILTLQDRREASRAVPAPNTDVQENYA